MRFNHVANRIVARYFDIIVELFRDKLFFVELRRNERAIWMRQPGANIDLQLSRVMKARIDPERERSQVSFLSDDPRADLESLASWLKERGVPAHVGAWSDREFFLDAPDALVGFVIEAMRPELADYPVTV